MIERCRTIPFVVVVGIGTQKIRDSMLRKVVALLHGAPNVLVLLLDEATFHRDPVHWFRRANSALLWHVWSHGR